MADTERIDNDPTVLNESLQRRKWMHEDLHRLQKALSKDVSRVCSIALGVLLVANFIMAGVFWTWASNLRIELVRQQAQGVATDLRVTELDNDAVRREQLSALADKVKDVESAAFAMRGSVADIKRQQERLDAMIVLVSGNITTLGVRVTEESESRALLIKSMRELQGKLDAR